MYTPIKITAYPQMAIISDELLPIDGILLYYAMQEKYGKQEYTLPGALTNPLVDLPIQKLGEGKEWYYASSCAEWVGKTPGNSFWTKRSRKKEAENIVDFKGKKENITITEGRYKSYQMPIFYHHAHRIHWYVVGDKEKIVDLLSQCTHIGKKTAHGWGRVIWQVEEWHSDWSVYKEGELMRPIPTEEGMICVYGIRPPYWLAENATFCILPDSINIENYAL